MRYFILIVWVFFIVPSAYATNDRIARTFQVIQCDKSEKSFEVVPIYFGTYSSSPESEVLSVLAPKLIPSSGYEDPPELNEAVAHGIKFVDVELKQERTLSVTLDLKNLSEPPGSLCSTELIIRATVEAIQCAAIDQGIKTLLLNLEPKATIGSLNKFGRKYDLRRLHPKCGVALNKTLPQ